MTRRYQTIRIGSSGGNKALCKVTPLLNPMHSRYTLFEVPEKSTSVLKNRSIHFLTYKGRSSLQQRVSTTINVVIILARVTISKSQIFLKRPRALVPNFHLSCNPFSVAPLLHQYMAAPLANPNTRTEFATATNIASNTAGCTLHDEISLLSDIIKMTHATEQPSTSNRVPDAVNGTLRPSLRF